MKRVIDARLRGGGSMFAPFKYHWWELELECGHTEERRIRWLPPKDGSRPRRGWDALHRAPSLDRLPPEPNVCSAISASQHKDGELIDDPSYRGGRRDVNLLDIVR